MPKKFDVAGSLIPHAEEFKRQTEATGGSTFHLASRSFVPVSEHHDPTKPDQFLVGKEPDTSGRPVPTTTLSSSQFDLSQAHAHIVRSAIQTAGSKSANAGSWVNDKKKNVDLDVSGKYADEGQAKKLGRQRREKAIYGTNPGREIFLK